METHVNTLDIVEETNKNEDSQVVNSDHLADKVQADVALIHETPVGETITREASIGTNAGSSPALLDREESEHLRTRWNEIQGKFVDEPRSAVQQADALVSEVIEKINQIFANEHSSLEGQWNQGNNVSTEDLRKALQRYRSFFNRLVV
jgi:type VI protein secretion system component VasK